MRHGAASLPGSGRRCGPEPCSSARPFAGNWRGICWLWRAGIRGRCRRGCSPRGPGSPRFLPSSHTWHLIPRWLSPGRSTVPGRSMDRAGATGQGSTDHAITGTDADTDTDTAGGGGKKQVRTECPQVKEARCLLHSGSIHVSPDIPTGNGTIRPPCLGQGVAFPGSGQFGQAMAVAQRGPHAKVVDGEAHRGD